MIRILLDNNKSRVVGSRQVVAELNDIMKIRSPNYFWSVAWRQHKWDGYVRYVTETGLFSTGLLHEVVYWLKHWGKKFKIEDGRDSFKDLHEITKLGDKEFRPYQKAAIHATLNNTFEGVKYIRGILHEATNAGKNLIAAGIIKSFSNKRTWVFLIDNSEIYGQAIEELEELMPGEIGQIQGKTVKWGRVTIAMVQSLSNLIKKDSRAKAKLGIVDGIIVDEADTTITKKAGQHVAAYCFNATIRIALSGTPLVHKDKTRNHLVLAYFGPIIHKISNKELVDQGYSAKPTIRFHNGNTKHRYDGDYQKEYRLGIVKSKERNKKVWKIIRKAVLANRVPILILVKLHKQITYLMKYGDYEIMETLGVTSVHHKTKGRAQIFKQFSQEKIPILISSMIIRRGKNLPIMRTLINAAGGDSEANTLQVLGRGLRRLPGKKDKIDFHDFWDEGKYLRRHSFHRLRTYKKEGFPIKELYKK